jgi:hypothetical protein
MSASLPARLGLPIHVLSDDKGMMDILINQLSVKIDNNILKELDDLGRPTYQGLGQTTTATVSINNSEPIDIKQLMATMESIPKAPRSPTHVIVDGDKMYAITMPQVSIAPLPPPEFSEDKKQIYFRGFLDAITPRRTLIDSELGIGGGNYTQPPPKPRPEKTFDPREAFRKGKKRGRVGRTIG